MMNLIYNTGLFSLIVQLLCGVFDIYVLNLEVESHIFFLKKLLWIEIFVQVIEAIFYIWLVTSFAKTVDITRYRYYDWFFTTPSMLFTYCMFLIYINDAKTPFYSAIQENFFVFSCIGVLNALMLLFGYLAEIRRITHLFGAILGFIPFFIMFYIIYENYAKQSSLGQITFLLFSGIWGLYGIASLLSYAKKKMRYIIYLIYFQRIFSAYFWGFLYYPFANFLSIDYIFPGLRLHHNKMCILWYRFLNQQRNKCLFYNLHSHTHDILL